MPEARDDLVDAMSLAAASAVVERGYPMGCFARLADRLAAPEGEARVRLAFRTTGGVPTGALQVRAEIALRCQRCLGPVRRMLESGALLAFVEHDDAAVPEGHETIAGDPASVDLATLVEDELLLSLPLIVMHDAGERCLAEELQATVGASAGPPAPEMRRPFAGLKELLKR